MDIADIAQIEDAVEVEARQVQLAYAAAGRQKQFGIGERFALIRVNGFGLPVDFRHPCAELHGDVFFFVKFRRFEIDPVDADFPGEELLGKRRALIGNVGLVADHRDRALIAFLAQARRCLSGRMARAHNHHMIAHCRSLPFRRLLRLPMTFYPAFLAILLKMTGASCFVSVTCRLAPPKSTPESPGEMQQGVAMRSSPTHSSPTRPEKPVKARFAGAEPVVGAYGAA